MQGTDNFQDILDYWYTRIPASLAAYVGAKKICITQIHLEPITSSVHRRINTKWHIILI